MIDSFVKDLYKMSIGESFSASNSKYKEALENMMLDKNYSVAKEMISCRLVNVIHNPKKHDYDGEMHERGVLRQVEVKPTTYWGKAKLNMKCAFADFTPERFDRHIADNPIIVSTGFNGTRLVYAVRFDFNEPPFVETIQEKMDAVLLGNKKKGTRIIPAPNINAISQIDNVSVLYPNALPEIEEHKVAVSRKVWNFLELKLQGTASE